jgi:hypothetical protein
MLLSYSVCISHLHVKYIMCQVRRCMGRQLPTISSSIGHVLESCVTICISCWPDQSCLDCDSVILGFCNSIGFLQESFPLSFSGLQCCNVFWRWIWFFVFSFFLSPSPPPPTSKIWILGNHHVYAKKTWIYHCARGPYLQDSHACSDS